MIRIVARNYPAPEHQEAILALARELVDKSRLEAGCRSYGLYQDVDHPELLTMLEEWESREALDRHMQSEHFTRIVPQLGRLMTRESELNVYRQLL